MFYLSVVGGAGQVYTDDRFYLSSVYTLDYYFCFTKSKWINAVHLKINMTKYIVTYSDALVI